MRPWLFSRHTPGTWRGSVKQRERWICGRAPEAPGSKAPFAELLAGAPVLGGCRVGSGGAADTAVHLSIARALPLAQHWVHSRGLPKAAAIAPPPSDGTNVKARASFIWNAGSDLAR